MGTPGFLYLPYHLAAIGHGRPGQLAPMLMAGAAVAGGGSFGFGWVRRFCGAIPVFVGGLVLCGAGLLTIASASQPALLYAGFALNGAGLGVIMPNMFSAFAAATPAIYRPRMLGFVRATFYGGPLIAQVALEPVLAGFGPTAAVAAITLICVAGAVLVLLFRRNFLPVEEPERHG